VTSLRHRHGALILSLLQVSFPCLSFSYPLAGFIVSIPLCFDNGCSSGRSFYPPHWTTVFRVVVLSPISPPTSDPFLYAGIPPLPRPPRCVPVKRIPPFPPPSCLPETGFSRKNRLKVSCVEASHNPFFGICRRMTDRRFPGPPRFSEAPGTSHLYDIEKVTVGFPTPPAPFFFSRSNCERVKHLSYVPFSPWAFPSDSTTLLCPKL